MRIKEVLSEGVFANNESKLIDRFTELGILPAAKYFINWIYHGAFNLPYSQLDKYEAAFYLINSVLSPKVRSSYAQLPVMYRGMAFSESKLQQISSGGLSIKSRIMAWTPYAEHAANYVRSSDLGTGVVIKHKPREEEVLLSMTEETEKFLGVSPLLVANVDETILSLPILKITPEIVDKVIV